MPAAYIKKTGSNLGHTQKRGEADKFIFIEKEQGRYYIYDQTAKCYLYYTATTNGNSVKNTAESNVRFNSDKRKANTWQLLMLSEETVAIVPAAIANANTASPALNFTGGIGNNCVLNLWRADDSNSAWEIIDPSAGSMACATLMYAQPGAPYIHKLVTNEGETVTSVDFGNISTLTLKDDRFDRGNKYKYVFGHRAERRGRICLQRLPHKRQRRRDTSQNTPHREQPPAIADADDELADMELVCTRHQPQQNGGDCEGHAEIRID